jgi:two-component system, NarL family, sensor kinase
MLPAPHRDAGASPVAVRRARRATRRPRPDAEHTPRRALVHFAMAGLTVLLLLAAVGTLVGRQAAHDAALDDARRITAAVARTAVEPNLQDELLTGDPAAIAAMERVFERVKDRPLTRVKLWTPDGRIVFSDDARLIGMQYPLPEDELEVLETGRAVAEVSDLSRAENALERGLGRALEVYLPVHTPSGQVLLFETYQPASSLDTRARDVWLRFLPILIGGLVLLQLVQFPLAARLARQTDRARRDRERMLHNALAGSDAERRRIAADLHDGVVQDLAATAIGLAGSAAAARRDGRPDDAGRLGSGAEAVRGAIRSLRTLVVDIHPPNLRRTGLAGALTDLTATLSARGVAVTLVVGDGAVGSERAEAFVYRVAQEALRNVAAHAGATAIEVRLDRRGRLLMLEVRDDGIGFDPDAPAPEDDRPRLGLRLLDDRAGDVDAVVEVGSSPGRGTTVRAEVSVT